jgi:hypothetical protein
MPVNGDAVVAITEQYSAYSDQIINADPPRQLPLAFNSGAIVPRAGLH